MSLSCDSLKNMTVSPTLDIATLLVGAYLWKVERQVKVLIKNLAIFFLFPSKEFLLISFKIELFVCLLCH